MNRKSSINLILFCVAGYFFVTSGEDTSPSHKEFVACLSEAKFDDTLQTQNVGQCLQLIEEKEWPDLCKKLTDLNLNFGPVCWETAIKDMPEKCVTTPNGQEEIKKMRTNLVIMQLDHCTKTYKADNTRMIKIMLEQQGYTYPLKG